jgi:hypothetical protein
MIVTGELALRLREASLNDEEYSDKAEANPPKRHVPSISF